MRDVFEVSVSEAGDTVKVGEALGMVLPAGSVVALSGELGAGKTVLTKGIAKGLGIEEEPVSPTYVIMNAYPGKTPLYHFDLYRVSSAQELEGIGYEEFVYGDGVCVVEWAERMRDAFPEDAVEVEIEMTGGNGGPRGRNMRSRGKKDWLSLFKSTVERVFPASKK